MIGATMNRKKMSYNIINFTVILLTVLLFVYDYGNFFCVFSRKNSISIVLLVFAVLIVHVIKATRLYLAMYGYEVDFVSYMKTYCKVTPVSVVIPFKLGEFFRIYCYGKQFNDMLKAIVIILLDRFMDTVALVTTIVLIWAFYGGNITAFVYILLIFLGFVLLLFRVYPGVYKFWKRYLLRAKASKRKITVLKLLEAFHKIYSEIVGVTKGKGIILYFMSLVAWGVEVASLTLLNGIFLCDETSQMVLDYMASAMNGNQSMELKQFVAISVVLLIILYLLIKAIEMILRKKVYR